MASQESIHPRVQNKGGLGTAECRRGSAGLALACGSKFMPCPCPESVSSKQVSQVSAPAGFSRASNYRRPVGRWASRSRGDARIILPPSPQVRLPPWWAQTLCYGSSSQHSSGSTAWPPDQRSPDGNSPSLLKLINGLLRLFHSLSLVPHHWLLTH